jgi:hypothetical protein
MWIAWLILRLPRSDSRRVFRFPEDTPAGAVPSGGEVIAPGEPGSVADAVGDGPGDHGADAEDLREAGARP